MQTNSTFTAEPDPGRTRAAARPRPLRARRSRRPLRWARTRRRAAASGTTARASGGPSRRRTPSPRSARRSRSAGRSPPRPPAVRTPRPTRRPRTSPSGTSSRRTLDGARAGHCRRARRGPPRLGWSRGAFETSPGGDPRVARRELTRTLPLDQPTGRKRLVRARRRGERAQPLLGDDRVLVLAEHVLEDLRPLHDGLAVGELRGVARALAALAQAVQLLVRRIVVKRLHGFPQLLHLSVRDRRERHVRLGRSELVERGREGVEQGEVALTVERLQHRCALPLSLALERAQQPLRRALVLTLEIGRL